MKIALLALALSVSIPLAANGQGRPAPPARGQRAPAQAPAGSTNTAEAYQQFLLAHRLEQTDDVDGAAAAYKRAMELDPQAADIPAQVAALFLRQNRVQDAMTMADAALKIDAANREANRVLGVVYAAIVESSGDARNAAAGDVEANLAKAIRHLELVIDHPAGETDPNVRATLARLYMRAQDFEKAITLLTDLVNQEPGWQEGPLLLVQAFTGAGRPRDAVSWLELKAPENPTLLPVLADFYVNDRRWKEAVDTYAAAVAEAPDNLDLKTRYATALLNAGAPEDILKARDVLGTVAEKRPNDARVLYMLSQAERRSGNFNAAEATARRVIAVQGGKSPFGYFALAEALEERRDYAALVAALTPAVAAIREQPGDNAGNLSLLLPHLAFAHQALGEHEEAIVAFAEAHRLAPTDVNVTASLADAYIAAKKYGAAADTAKQGLEGAPGDPRLARLEARALRLDGKTEQGIAVLENFVKQQADHPGAYIALAEIYSDAGRGPEAVKVLQDAEAKFPSDTSILFELGAVYDKQKKFMDAEAAFRRLLAIEPDNGPVLNYLGYMLADRGERLDESVALLKKALEKEPYNGSYLDSLGWAYFKGDKLDLAEVNLRRAAEQLKANSVIQNHYGDVLFKLARYDDAIAAWTRALEGDGDAIERADIDKKIRAAKQKTGKK